MEIIDQSRSIAQHHDVQILSERVDTKEVRIVGQDLIQTLSLNIYDLEILPHIGLLISLYQIVWHYQLALAAIQAFEHILCDGQRRSIHLDAT